MAWDKEKAKEYSKQWYQDNKERIKQSRESNKEKSKEYRKEYYQVNKERIKEFRKIYREANKVSISVSKKQARKRKKEDNICHDCSFPREYGVWCKFHKFQQFAKTATKSRDEIYKKIGYKPRLKTTEAKSLIEKQRRLERKNNGLCRSCLNASVVTTFCFYHYIKGFARNATVSAKNKRGKDYSMALRGKELDNLTNHLIAKWHAQNERCYYTGLPLVIGENLSLDHIYPSSNNPDLQQDINNMVWTTKSINNFKNSHTPKEFYNAMMELKEGLIYLENNQDFKKYLTE